MLLALFQRFHNCFPDVARAASNRNNDHRAIRLHLLGKINTIHLEAHCQADVASVLWLDLRQGVFAIRVHRNEIDILPTRFVRDGLGLHESLVVITDIETRRHTAAIKKGTEFRADFKCRKVAFILPQPLNSNETPRGFELYISERRLLVLSLTSFSTKSQEPSSHLLDLYAD